MEQTTRCLEHWQGYYLEDCDCKYCLHYNGQKRGCKLEKCCCDEEKQDAVIHGRIKRNEMKVCCVL